MSNQPISQQPIASPALQSEPLYLRAGDSWAWNREFADYPSGDGWTLLYVLNSVSWQFKFPAGSITADEDGDGFDVLVSSSGTAGVAPGTYQLLAILSNTVQSSRVTIPIQTVVVSANIADADGPVDTRSFVKKTLDILEAAMVGDASPLVQEYEITGRRVAYMNRKELKELRDQFKWEYEQELRKAGEFVRKRRVRIRFSAWGN